jgi:hypothetical protein
VVEVKVKMEEFNLSKRIIILPDSNDLLDELKTAPVLMTKDVKEFIKRLKEFVKPKDEIINEFCCPTCMWKKRLFEEIDKLAGKNLAEVTKWK